MQYQTFQPHPDLSSIVKCYWTLEIPANKNSQRQRIIPDGCIELAFILGEDIKRYTTDHEFIIQPRCLLLGQTIDPFYIEPTGYVNTFAIRFYPYGLANLISMPIKSLTNKETSLKYIWSEEIALDLEQKMINAPDSTARIQIIEHFLLTKFSNQSIIDKTVKSTIDALLKTKGAGTIKNLVAQDSSTRRQLERKFMTQIGISPKQLGKVIRLQAALKMLLNRDSQSLTKIAYESEYYDQAHFNKDFKEFTGINPKEFLEHDEMALSSLFYTKD